eukprot:Tbor_TRINITY_DN3354_c0_g1::TRINITY_DN3354_c0_g1_i1::g.23420::m.23420
MIGKIALFAGSATIFSGTAYIVGIIAAPSPKYNVSHEQRLSTFEDIAPVYERKTQTQEFYLGITKMRRRMLQENAKGRVLEVGAGTGNNVGLYPAERCDEVILSDRAAKMTEVSAEKVKYRLGYTPYSYPALPVDEKAPIKLDKIKRQKQQKESQKDYNDRIKHKQEQRHRLLSDENSPLLDKNVERREQPHVSDNSLPSTDNCCDVNRMVSKTATLTTSGQSILAERDRYIQEKQIERILIERKKAQEREGHVQQHHHVTSKENSALSSQKELYSIANYPAENLPFQSNTFDTVVDVFGLCSFEDPVAALGEMSRVCKPNGRVLLLEHGRGKVENLNWYLDKWAPRHAASWGCWWNRDIRRFVRTAGLTVISKEEKHFGTTQLLVLAPYKSMSELKEAGRSF